MDDQVRGQINLHVGRDGLNIQASDGVPTGLIIQAVDAYSIVKRQESNATRQQRNSQKWSDFIQSGFMLAALIFSLGFVLNVAGCGGQSSPYKQYQNQWGAAK